MTYYHFPSIPIKPPYIFTPTPPSKSFSVFHFAIEIIKFIGSFIKNHLIISFFLLVAVIWICLSENIKLKIIHAVNSFFSCFQDSTSQPHYTFNSSMRELKEGETFVVHEIPNYTPTRPNTDYKERAQQRLIPENGTPPTTPQSSMNSTNGRAQIRKLS